MINISNYARQLELKKFSKINEQLVIEKAPVQPDTQQVVAPEFSFDLFIASKPGSGGQYEMYFANIWKQIAEYIVGFVDKKQYSGTIEFDETLVVINWKVDTTPENLGKVTLMSGTKKGANTKFDQWADKLGTALANGMNEDEDAVYSLFRDDIKTEADFNGFKQYWDSQGFEYPKRGVGALYGRQWDSVKKNKSGSQAEHTSLDQWINRYFSTREKTHLNSLLSYTNYRFK